MKKGFTLIELLAVIVILAIIALIATPIILSIINDTKTAATLRSVEYYLQGVEQSVAKKGMTPGGAYRPNICIIQEDGNLLCDNKDKIVVEIKGEKPSSGRIVFENGKIDDILISLESDTIFKNEQGKIQHYASPCIRITGDKNTPGSLYECEVKDGVKYNFYVLSQESDGTTNLIMDRNICGDGTLTSVNDECEVGWISWRDYNDDENYGAEGGSNDKGPITAMNYLYNATKDWNNISNIVIEYEDEGNAGDYGYGKIVTVNGITKITQKDGTSVTVLSNQEGYVNLKARMPYLKEVKDYDGNNGYLYNNLDFPKCYVAQGNYSKVPCGEAGYILGVYEDGVAHIEGKLGYWIFSSKGDFVDLVDYVSSDGKVTSDFSDESSLYGVRPIINLKLQ